MNKSQNINELVEKVRNSAIEEYEELKNKDYPICSNVPVTLFGPSGKGQDETSYTHALAFLLNKNENRIVKEACEEAGL